MATITNPAKVGKELTDALAKYVAGNVNAVIPPKEFFTLILGMDVEQAEVIEKAALAFVPPVVDEVDEVDDGSQTNVNDDN